MRWRGVLTPCPPHSARRSKASTRRTPHHPELLGSAMISPPTTSIDRQRPGASDLLYQTLASTSPTNAARSPPSTCRAWLASPARG
jgi:hypothetical protein